MSIRFKFGPRLVGHYAPPEAVGALPDVSPTAVAKGVRKVGPGLIDLDIVFTLPAYSTADYSQLVEVHAIAFPQDQPIPADAELAIAANYPKNKADVSAVLEGGDIVVTIPSAAMGGLRVQTVFGYADPPAAPAPGPATPSAPPETAPTAPETPATPPTVTEPAPVAEAPAPEPEPVATPTPATS